MKAQIHFQLGSAGPDIDTRHFKPALRLGVLAMLV